MPENQNLSVQICRTDLTAPEKRELARAEHIIASGLKSFLAVGMALKEIRDKRLYRQHYDTFEQYVAVRWELSRLRAYELAIDLHITSALPR